MTLLEAFKKLLTAHIEELQSAWEQVGDIYEPDKDPFIIELREKLKEYEANQLILLADANFLVAWSGLTSPTPLTERYCQIAYRLREDKHVYGDAYLKFAFNIGDKVIKKTGYKYPGVIVSYFKTLRGLERYVVECTVPGCEGMLHIFNGDQLELNNVP